MSASDFHLQTVGITGAGGFIGSHLTELMLRHGYRVRALIHYNALGSLGHLEEVIAEGQIGQEAWVEQDRLEVVLGDIQDARCMHKFVRGCRHVFHLAALIGIPYSYTAPSSYVQVNVNGTLNVLEACRDEEVERLVVTSTSETYGTAREVPMTERHPLQGQSPYSATKIGADKLAEAYHRSFGLPVTTLRPFNTYGPRQSMRAVIPTILAQALSEECERIELGALDPVRDLMYVEDNARGYLALALAPLDHIAGRLYNMGTGRGWTVEEIAQLALKVVGVEKEIVSRSERLRPQASEVGRLVCDSTRFTEEVGWTPQIDLEDGLRRTAAWVERNLHLYRPQEYRV